MDEATLLETTARLGGTLADPIKTTNVQNQRCMTTWVVMRAKTAMVERYPAARCDVAIARPDPVPVAGDADADRVELAVAGLRRGIAEHVLVVQLLGDARGRRVEVRGRADDFRPPAALARDLVQRVDVDALGDRLRLRRVDRDGIDEGVGADQRRTQSVQRHVAGRVGAVGDEDEGGALARAVLDEGHRGRIAS